ncbi:MAG: hypothetical protein ACOH5I_24805, partial [Oligoflexus sp.]
HTSSLASEVFTIQEISSTPCISEGLRITWWISFHNFSLIMMEESLNSTGQMSRNVMEGTRITQAYTN